MPSSRRETSEAKQAIDALQSLVPHVGGEVGHELQSTLTGLQLAFVQAAFRVAPPGACDT